MSLRYHHPFFPFIYSFNGPAGRNPLQKHRIALTGGTWCMNASTPDKPKILVVDDEPDNLDLLYRTFYRDFEVLRATDGGAALDLLSAVGEVAVIISDQRMPGMSGTDLFNLTATQYPDTIRILLTGYTDVEDLVEAINSSKVFKYVTKPWEAAELKAVVRQAIDTHQILKARTQELQRTLRQETLLNTVTNTIRSALNYQQILQTIVETVGHLLEVDCCILRPVQDDRLKAEWFVYTADSPAAVGAEEGELSASSLCPTRPSLVHTVWETHQILVIDHAETDKRIHSDPTGVRQRAYQEAQIASSLVVPLLCQQELMAVLALHQCRQPRCWRSDEVQLIRMVADQAALTLSQARAYERVRSLAKREALLNTITATIRSSLDPQEIFAAITQQLGQALHADGCALSLWTQEDEYVHCVGLYDVAQADSATGDRSPHPSRPSPSGPITPWFGDYALSDGFAFSNRSDLWTPDDPRPPFPQSLVPIKENPVLQRLLAIQAPVIIDDLTQQSELNIVGLPLRSPARALLIVPLLYNGKIIGSISLRQVHRSRHWETDEVELAQAVAAQAAIAVQQSQLYQTTRQQAEQLLELDRQKTAFFQTISHEFRTPLTLMLGPLESAVEQQQGLSYDQCVIALRNSRRLLRMVNQLLDLQRLDAGRMQPKFRPCDLLNFVTQIVDSFRAYCDKKRIHLLAELEAGSPIYLDVEKFDKVLYNLLSNAIKFTPSGGQIEVRLLYQDEHCLLQVKDTGMGIQADQLPYLFERFRQADGSTNRSHEGSGLGLALVKELVHLHGGQITVESVYGQGTTFTVWLPTGVLHLPPDQVIRTSAEPEANRAIVERADVELADIETALHPPATTDLSRVSEGSTASDSAGVTLLVVEDNADMRGYIASVLQRVGYRVCTARHGAEGIEMAQRCLPQLIVTDLMMPLISGLELIQSIRQHETLRGTPIILLTAKADEESRIEGTEQGADAYLAKPFNDRELLAEVRNLLALKASEQRVTQLNTYLTESVLRRFLPASLVQKAARGELVLDLRPEPRMVTILFSDIIGFTQLSNTLRSRKVAELLNEYLTEMTHVIFDHGGTVDKFMGDAILALFGAPEELSPNEQVSRAIAAARGMYRALAQLNERWQAHGMDQIVQFRCGIHQGTAVVGMFGGAERADYTAIGPSVNIAARIQEAAEPSTILVSAAVADYLDDQTITKFSPLKLKGVDETVLTFCVHPD